MQFYIHASNLVRALSQALELSTHGLSRHHARTAVVAWRIGQAMQLPAADMQRLVFAAFLHDIGAASNWQEKKRLQDFNLNAFEAYNHCHIGYLLLRESEQLGMLAPYVLHHHDAYAGHNRTGLTGNDIPLLSRIINVADRVEVLLRDDVYILLQRPSVLVAIEAHAGKLFDPAVVAALRAAAERDAFWLDLANAGVYSQAAFAAEWEEKQRYTIDDITAIAHIFANVIDRTSRFTARHSEGVAAVAALLGAIRGFSALEIDMLRIAGLLHDLGKLAVPNSILEKPGPLTSDEVLIIRQHTYYTYHILMQLDGFDAVAEWAAYHHETLDGQGYPFGIGGDGLRLGSRIMAVADIFTALTEQRPYRPALQREDAAAIMRQMAEANKIDAPLVDSLFAHYDEAAAAVRGGEDEPPRGLPVSSC